MSLLVAGFVAFSPDVCRLLSYNEAGGIIRSNHLQAVWRDPVQGRGFLFLGLFSARSRKIISPTPGKRSDPRASFPALSQRTRSVQGAAWRCLGRGLVGLPPHLDVVPPGSGWALPRPLLQRPLFVHRKCYVGFLFYQGLGAPEEPTLASAPRAQGRSFCLGSRHHVLSALGLPAHQRVSRPSPAPLWSWVCL